MTERAIGIAQAALVPRVPNYILLRNGGKVAIQELDDDTLKKIGQAWTEELIDAAKAKRAAR